MTAQLIPVKTWAEQMFGDNSPHPNTLLRWIHLSKISPPPVRIGRRYFCSPLARYYDPSAEQIARLANGR